VAKDLRSFFEPRNRAVRIDLFEELSDQAAVAIRSFSRRIGAPHLLDEIILPRLREGHSQLLAAVQDRPWPPWGLGARQIVALCQSHLINDESYALSAVYVADEDLTNIGLITAVFKEALDQIAISPRAEIAYLVGEGSVLVDHVLTKTGFRKSDDVFVTWAGRYHTYYAPATAVLAKLGIDKLSAPDLLAHDMDSDVLETNALFHGTLYLGNRAEWAIDRAVSEVLNLVRGAAGGKPGGVPGGTGQWAFDPADLVEVEVANVLGPVEQQQLLDFLIENENNFVSATVVEPGAAAATVNEKLRRSRTFQQLGKYEAILTEKVKQHLQAALNRLGHKAFPLGRIEIQATASNDGDYFRLHPDSDANDTREISFVYFLHREPRRFSGGELRIFNTKVIDGQVARADHSHTLSPRQDALVFFPSMNQHEVLPVRVPSKEFGDSRFTINGWIHRAT
jgi:Rps23 Pro-64 3,4-dihydroxylase Tpa1-like proline 4-hydroxylase